MKRTSVPQLHYIRESSLFHGGLQYKDHIADTDGKTLCGATPNGQLGGEVTLDNLDEGRWTPLCEKCRRSAPLRLRPRASYWYLDPWTGSSTREFPTLKKAEKAASKEHCSGSICIHQLGPGRTNKVATFVEGLPPLP